MRLRLPHRRGPSPEELAAIDAARRSKAAAEDVREQALQVRRDNPAVSERVRQLRVDNHLGEYILSALRGNP